MEFETGDLVRVRLRLKNRGWTSVAGRVCDVKESEVVVMTMAGLRTVSPPDLSRW